MHNRFCDVIVDTSCTHNLVALLKRTMSKPEARFYNIADITEIMFGKEITVHARVHRARRQGKIAFVQLRQVHNFEPYFCKAVLIHGIGISLDMLKWVGRLARESIVQMTGIVQQTPQKDDIELIVSKIRCISPSESFNFENERIRDWPTALIARQPESHTKVRVSSTICASFREFLDQRGYVEIHTPKLTTIEYAKVQKVDSPIHNQNIYLSSTNLYKMIAVQADMGPVYEIGPRFDSVNRSWNVRNEYTALDMEMPIFSSYYEVIDVVELLIQHICTSLIKITEDADQVIPKIARISHEEYKEYIRDAGENPYFYYDDRVICRHITQVTGCEILIVFDLQEIQGSCVTVVDQVAKSFKIFFRGIEIGTGAQHIHDIDFLERRLSSFSRSLDEVRIFAESLRYGAVPMGGCCIGLERFVMAYTKENNIRKAAVFHNYEWEW